MTAIEPARLINGRYVCRRCTADLGRPVGPPNSDRPGLLFKDVFYVRAPDDPREPTLTILTLRRRARRRRKTDDRGQIPAPREAGYPLPVLMPCRRPTCGQVNRIDIDGGSDPPV